MAKYKTGGQVFANLGTLPVVGTVIEYNSKLGKYHDRFSAVQPDWYAEEERTPYPGGTEL